MTKKDYILKLLEALKDTWPMAQGLKLLVQWNVMSDDLINILTDILTTAINEATNEWQKTKLKKWAEFLEKLKKVELEQRKKEEKELSQLDTMLENI